MPNRFSGAAQRSGALRGRSGALGRSPGPQGLCSAQQAPSSSAGAQGLCSAPGALSRRPRAMWQAGGAQARRGHTRSGAQAPSRHLGLCSSLGALRHSAGAQQAPKGCAALRGTQTCTMRSGAVQCSAGAQQQAPSWRCRAQGVLRCPPGARGLCSAREALSSGRLAGGAAPSWPSGAQQAPRSRTALRGHSVALRGPAGGAALRGRSVTLRGAQALTRRSGAVQCSAGA